MARLAGGHSPGKELTMKDHKDFLKTIDSPTACPGGIEIPTRKEQAVLAEMRRVKDRVRKIKSELEGLEAGVPQDSNFRGAALKQELSRLRSLWDDLESRRKSAARERMVLLGHENPDGSLP